MHRLWLMGLVLLSQLSLAHSPVALSALDKGMVGQKTQVLVLGSVHLSQTKPAIPTAKLKPLLDRLAAFKPNIITIEGMSGEQCDYMSRYPTVYSADDIRDYCVNTKVARQATGLDIPHAIAARNQLLSSWPAKPGYGQRRHLAAVFLAAGDSSSAMVQWLQLPVAERHPGEGLNALLVAKLNKLITYQNEDIQIAAVLAARLGLQRVYPVDDQTGNNIAVDNFQTYGKAVQKAWARADKQREPITLREDALVKQHAVLDLYRFINNPNTQRITIATDMGAALKDPSPQHYGRIYVAAWEARNMRMVSNVQTTFRDRPGVRVLCIVGATHKPWFDNLLGQMQGVEIVDVEQVLQ